MNSRQRRKRIAKIHNDNRASEMEGKRIQLRKKHVNVGTIGHVDARFCSVIGDSHA